MPWFSEIDEILEESGELISNYQAFHKWLYLETSAGLAPAPELRGLVNRRRVWEVSMQLAGSYIRYQDGRYIWCQDGRYIRYQDAPKVSSFDDRIAKTAVCLHKSPVIVSFEESSTPIEQKSQKVWFTSSWAEINWHLSTTFDVFYEDKKDHTRIVGFGIACGDERRIWGVDGDKMGDEAGEYIKASMTIDPDTWINKLSFYIHQGNDDCDSPTKELSFYISSIIVRNPVHEKN